MKSVLFSILALGLCPLSLLAESLPEKDANFSHRIETEKKPWLNRPFRNDPASFQFAIVTDRTGGMRPGVFPEAVAKVNELQPEFVITVGDLIPGGTRQRDEKEIWRQWDEFNGFIEGFEMPFFYLPGNHDVSNAVMDRIWDQQFGVRYYSFVYKDVLFLCLNTQDAEGPRPFLGQEQIDWVETELEDFPDVRWTMVFIHQPLWVMEERASGEGDGDSVPKKSKTGWPEVEAALAGRRHTVYAGHVHRYAKYERNEANYYTLGTTGGGSALRGSTFGEFDHATWITMTDQGPRMMNLTLDGMLEEDVTTEAHQRFWRGLRFSESFESTYPFEEQVVTLPLENLFEGPLTGRLSWILPSNDNWMVRPPRLYVKLDPGEKKEVTFTLTHQGEVSTYLPLPRLDAHFHGDEDGFHLERSLYLPLDMVAHAREYPTRASFSATDTPPEIDGRLDDPAWKAEPDIGRLVPMKADGYAMVETEAWLRYDDEFLYVGVHCEEPLLGDVRTEISGRDGKVWEDDSIEVLFDTNRDQKTYLHFAVNSRGVLYDGQMREGKWNSQAKVATHAGDEDWSVELAIPLKDLGLTSDALPELGFQMARHRPRMDVRISYQWAPTFWYGNYAPSLFGLLKPE